VSDLLARAESALLEYATGALRTRSPDRHEYRQAAAEWAVIVLALRAKAKDK